MKAGMRPPPPNGVMTCASTCYQPRSDEWPIWARRAGTRRWDNAVSVAVTIAFAVRACGSNLPQQRQIVVCAYHLIFSAVIGVRHLGRPKSGSAAVGRAVDN